MSHKMKKIVSALVSHTNCVPSRINKIRLPSVVAQGSGVSTRSEMRSKEGIKTQFRHLPNRCHVAQDCMRGSMGNILGIRKAVDRHRAKSKSGSLQAKCLCLRITTCPTGKAQ